MAEFEATEGKYKINEGSGCYSGWRSMDSLFLNRMITPKADKPRGKGT